VKHGKGARITDLDDNVYVDYRMGYGPAILGLCRSARRCGGARGHGGRRRVRAVDRARTHVAERISKMVPAAELVRFSNSGTEAVMAGLRLARAYTGKDDYVILEGGYHGLFDAAMWFTPMDKWSQVGDPEVKPYSEGRAGQHAQLRALRAGQRRQSARGRVQAPCGIASPAC
jgi:glutamate-1-semialdehyde 2,1-aminomutase